MFLFFRLQLRHILCNLRHRHYFTTKRKIPSINLSYIIYIAVAIATVVMNHVEIIHTYMHYTLHLMIGNISENIYIETCFQVSFILTYVGIISMERILNLFIYYMIYKIFLAVEMRNVFADSPYKFSYNPCLLHVAHMQSR